VITQELGVLYAPSKPDAEIEFTFELAKVGRYHVAAVLIESVFSSRYQPFLDGRPAGPELDLCNQGEDWTWHTLDLHDLAAGKHRLKFAGRGASPKERTLAQAQFAFGLNSLVLLRLEDMDGYEPTPETHPKK
jgi:gamma-glutamylcysteine synthetase